MWETLGSPATVEQRLRHRRYVRGVLQRFVQGQSVRLQGVQGQSCGGFSVSRRSPPFREEARHHEEARRQEEASQQLSYYAQEASLRE